MNVVCLMGRLTADPEIRQTPNGISVCSFSIAVDRYVKDGDKKTDFINCVAWRSNAENIARFFGKGQMIAINGSIQTRQYQDKDTGKNRTAFEVLVDHFHFTGGKSSGESQQPAPAPVQTQAPAQSYQQKPQQNWQQQAQQMGFGPQHSRFSTADLDGFSTISDDGDLPF